MSGVHTFRWDGESMAPRSPKAADESFVIGQFYRMEVREERSASSHSHYFAAIHDAWLNLPEEMAAHFATAEHFRKYALIRTGWHDERQIVCASKAEAQRIAAFIRPMDEYAVVIAREAVVTVYTAKSQSYRAMGRKDFQKSKQDVLDYIASLIGVPPEQLQREAGKAA